MSHCSNYFSRQVWLNGQKLEIDGLLGYRVASSGTPWSTLRNTPEERRSHQHRGGRLKSQTKGRWLRPSLALWLVVWSVARSVIVKFHLNFIQALLATDAGPHRHPTGNTRCPYCRTSWPRRNATPLHPRGKRTTSTEGCSPQILRGSSQPGCRGGWNCTLPVCHRGPSNALGFVGQGWRPCYPQRPPNPLRTRRSENSRDIRGNGRRRGILPHRPGERSRTHRGQCTAGSHRWVERVVTGRRVASFWGPTTCVICSIARLGALCGFDDNQ